MDERMLTFIHSFDSEKPLYLCELEKYSKETGVPIIRPHIHSLLRLLITWSRPMKILEVGTAIGFSALLMSEYAPKGCHITTIEKYDKRIPLARENFRKAGKEDFITLIEGDAAEILSAMNEDGMYDIIFMDAAKGQYINFLPDILRLLSPKGLIVSDNILQEGELIESKYAVTRRNRTIHNRMREYLYALTHNDELETTILPVADGVALSAKRSIYKESSNEKQ
jgi:predicted O-methyltransferase YrrM